MELGVRTLEATDELPGDGKGVPVGLRVVVDICGKAEADAVLVLTVIRGVKDAVLGTLVVLRVEASGFVEVGNVFTPVVVSSATTVVLVLGVEESVDVCVGLVAVAALLGSGGG